MRPLGYRKLLGTLAGWLVMAGTAWGQAALDPAERVDTAIARLLPPGELRVAVMDSVAMNPRLAVLLAKFQRGVQANPQYLLDMQHRAAKQGPGELPYDARCGLAEPEFRELQLLMSKRELRVVPTYVGTLRVRHQAGTIRFAGSGKLAVLNDVWLDLAKNEVHVATYTLPYKKRVVVPTATNAYGSAWAAYEWELMQPGEAAFDHLTLDKLRTLDLVNCQFQVGTLTATHQLLLKLKARRIDKGVKKFDREVPFVAEQ